MRSRLPPLSRARNARDLRKADDRNSRFRKDHFKSVAVAKQTYHRRGPAAGDLAIQGGHERSPVRHHRLGEADRELEGHPYRDRTGRGIGLRSAPTALETSKENAGVKISDVGPPILVGRHSGEAISETGHFLPMPERPPAPRSRRDRNKSSGRQVSL